MANPRNIHLFNCDRTYKLDIVENWLTETKAKPGRGFPFSVKQHYFTLPQMSEMSTETIPGLEMDLAVFVVHAHESRLSINEDNAGIGYAKIYRALQGRTKGKVIIVIGGDDNYKDGDEEDREVISRWARRKVSSQFSEEFMDGRKSFIFSWNKKHRKIHEEALLHFLDPSKKEKKLEYQPPKREPPPQSLRQPPAKGQEQSRKMPGETQTQLQQGSRDPRQTDDLLKEKKTDCRHRSAYCAQPINEREGSEEARTQHRLDVKDPLRSYNLLEEKETDYGYPSASYDQLAKRRNRPEKTTPQQLPGINDPLRTGKPFKETMTDNDHPRKAERVVHEDLSVLGWNAKPESFWAVSELIERHRDQLNLKNDPYVLNKELQDLISYLENNPLKYCVLVVDAEKVNTIAREEDDNYLKLLKAAETNVDAKIIVIVCCPLSLSVSEDKTLNCAMERALKDSSKVFVAWLKNGELTLQEGNFVSLLMSAFAGTRSYPQQQSKPSSSQQYLGHETSQPYAQVNTTACPSQGFQNRNASSSSRQCVPQPQAGATTSHPVCPPAGHFNFLLLLPPLKTIMVLTRLRNGRISNRPEDVEYWKPGFIIPDSMESYLLNNFQEKNDVELAVLQEKEKMISLVNKKIDRQQFIKLELNECIVLETRLKNGRISFEGHDVLFRHPNLQVPEHVSLSLQKDFATTGNAKLFVISDLERLNFKCIVQVGAFQTFKRYVKTKIKNI